MKRGNKQELPQYIDLLITGDIHLRDTVPESRVDDFLEVQFKKLQYISELQRNYQCPVLHTGDLFHHWKASPWLLSKTMRYLPHEFLTIYGNHDLPNHNIELEEKSGVYTLERAGALKVMREVTVRDGFLFIPVHWNQTITEEEVQQIIDDYRAEKGWIVVLVWHIMTYQGKLPYPGCVDTPSAGLLRKFKNVDLILTGHNHMTFVEELKGRYLINPGSPTRQNIAQIDHEPCIFGYIKKTNQVVRIPIPCEDGNEVLRKAESQERIIQREQRLDDFVNQLAGEWYATLDYKENIERYFSKNEIEPELKQVIYNIISK